MFSLVSFFLRVRERGHVARSVGIPDPRRFFFESLFETFKLRSPPFVRGVAIPESSVSFACTGSLHVPPPSFSPSLCFLLRSPFPGLSCARHLPTAPRPFLFAAAAGAHRLKVRKKTAFPYRDASTSLPRPPGPGDFCSARFPASLFPRAIFVVSSYRSFSVKPPTSTSPARPAGLFPDQLRHGLSPTRSLDQIAGARWRFPPSPFLILSNSHFPSAPLSAVGVFRRLTLWQLSDRSPLT